MVFKSRVKSEDRTAPGVLIINADDWGQDQETTVRTLECILRGSVSSVSAMVFMEYSDRAAAVAREREVDAGLHLNLTARFSAQNCPGRLLEHQNRLASYLSRPLAWTVYHPGLMRSFEYVVAAQIDEFCRLYGNRPERLDGHHHMHLCSNILFGGLFSPGTVVRRNFSFRKGEKSFGNRLFRQFIDHILARRHRLVDFFFSLAPIKPSERLQRIFSLARQYKVEIETHPVNLDEYRFLTSGEMFRFLGDLKVAARFAVFSGEPLEQKEPLVNAKPLS